MPYTDRIAGDWIAIYSDSNPDRIGHDPLLIIEVIIESSYSWSWSIISKIFELDIEGQSLPMLIAGPMESWMGRYATEQIELIEYEASTSERIKWALGGLPQSTEIDDQIWKRIELARGAPWPINSMPPIPPASEAPQEDIS